MNKEGKDLTHLGSKETIYPKEPDRSILECFDNRYPYRSYHVRFHCPEFTSLCPKTGQPDFASITVDYIPDKKCIETKSLKLYLFSFRNYGSFMETITNKILEDLIFTCQPKWMRISGHFNARGGIAIVVHAETGKLEETEAPDADKRWGR